MCQKIVDNLDAILMKYLKRPIKLIRCGGKDLITATREQWNDGANTLCVSPGKVIVYDRNQVTNDLLRNAGVTVLEINSSELSRGRGAHEHDHAPRGNERHKIRRRYELKRKTFINTTRFYTRRNSIFN